MSNSSIQWTQKTWNPTIGCTRVSQGCKNCYAFELHDKRHKGWQDGWEDAPKQYHKPFTTLQIIPERLLEPLRWKKPSRVFVNSMSDLFHPDIPTEFLDKVFAVMFYMAEVHTFQVLTKRPERMKAYLKDPELPKRLVAESLAIIDQTFKPSAVWAREPWIQKNGQKNTIEARLTQLFELHNSVKHPNIWLGVSVENQAAAEERISLLLDTPAGIRWLSCEPLLEAVDLSKWLLFLDWVVVGGESGAKARDFQIPWALDLLMQCKAYLTPFFMKQLGSVTVKRSKILGENGILHGRLSDKHGGKIEEFPEFLQVREYPNG